jgi:predicted DNA-binding transcriptional regulator AlpA
MRAATNPESRRWVRNGALAKYLGTTTMTVWRWRRNPAVNFPQASVINGIEYTDLQEVDEWMRARVVNRHGLKD